MARVDQIVLGAGLFGLAAADFATGSGLRVAIVDPDPVPLSRASFANQARLHLGYHYPRSVGTALQALHYHKRFATEFATHINNQLTKIYAVARYESHTSAQGFEAFCNNVGIPITVADPDEWFQAGTVEQAFICAESAFDARGIRAEMLERLSDRDRLSWHLGTRLERVERDEDCFELRLTDGSVLSAPRVLNATYASINQVVDLFGFEPLPITYELCELVLGRPSDALAPYGITVMDGPFFSVMPFGSTGLHSLSAVDYTPHHRSDGPLPSFPCQAHHPSCSPQALANCGTCPHRPPTLSTEMDQLMRRFLRRELRLEPMRSVLAVRPVLRISSVDDSRPTLVYQHSKKPELISVLSGKINTIYDLESLW
ncbi:MAG: FAD-binding oxidoreductase [Acidimicrobiales bacterium]|nr:FAD-binding oxidoreductase [Acidimicrobiales bacterium]